MKKIVISFKIKKVKNSLIFRMFPFMFYEIKFKRSFSIKDFQIFNQLRLKENMTFQEIVGDINVESVEKSFKVQF